MIAEACHTLQYFPLCNCSLSYVQWYHAPSGLSGEQLRQVFKLTYSCQCRAISAKPISPCQVITRGGKSTHEFSFFLKCGAYCKWLFHECHDMRPQWDSLEKITSGVKDISFDNCSAKASTDHRRCWHLCNLNICDKIADDIVHPTLFYCRTLAKTEVCNDL